MSTCLPTTPPAANWSWVHWTAPADGPDAADEVTARVEPLLRRTSEWRHHVSASGLDYWEADATWDEP